MGFFQRLFRRPQSQMGADIHSSTEHKDFRGESSTEKQCAVCGQVVDKGLVECPKCGSGVFNPKKMKVAGEISVSEFRRRQASYSQSFGGQDKGAVIFGTLAPKAQELLDKAKRGGRIDSHEYLPLMEIAETYWHGKNHSKAAAAYSILIHIAPNDSLKSAAYGARGIQFEELRDLDKAINDTTMAIKLLKACGLETFNRHAYSYYEGLGRQCQKRGDIEGAIKAYQEISKAHPKHFIMTENKSVQDKLQELEKMRRR